MSAKKLNYLLFLLIVLFWGGSFIAIKYVVQDWPPVFSAAARVALSLIVFAVYSVYLKKDLTLPFSIRWRCWVAGLFALGIPFSFLFWGERVVSPGLSGIINCTLPIWTFILSLVFFGKATNATPLKVIGLACGLIGVVVIFYPMLHFTNAHAEILGSLAVLVMVLSYAVASILGQYLFGNARKIDFYASLYHQHWSALVYLVLASLLLEKWPNVHEIFLFKPLMATIYLAVFSTAIAWFFYYYLIREWGAVRTSTVAYLIPIVALLGDFILFHTAPTLSEMIGVAIIIPSVIVIQFL